MCREDKRESKTERESKIQQKENPEEKAKEKKKIWRVGNILEEGSVGEKKER